MKEESIEEFVCILCALAANFLLFILGCGKDPLISRSPIDLGARYLIPWLDSDRTPLFKLAFLQGTNILDLLLCIFPDRNKLLCIRDMLHLSAVDYLFRQLALHNWKEIGDVTQLLTTSNDSHLVLNGWLIKLL